MKKMNVWAILFALCAFVFTGCNDDDNNDGKIVSGGTNDTYIEGTLTNWSNYDIDSVQLVLLYENNNDIDMLVLSSSQMNSGYFKLELPSSISDEYLTGLDDYFEQEVSVSDKSARMGSVVVIAYKGEVPVGVVNYMSGYSLPLSQMAYTYMTKAVTVKGTEIYEESYFGIDYVEKYIYNMNLAKGWNKTYNKMYESGYDEITEISTTPISGLKWYFIGQIEYSDEIYNSGEIYQQYIGLRRR